MILEIWFCQFPSIFQYGPRMSYLKWYSQISKLKLTMPASIFTPFLSCNEWLRKTDHTIDVSIKSLSAIIPNYKQVQCKKQYTV